MEPLLNKSEEYAFIHIPKNAGQAMYRSLKNIKEIIHCGHGVLFSNISHLKKIVIIRNPINRFTSAFFYLSKYKGNIDSVINTPEELVQGLISGDPDACKFTKVHVNNHYVNGKLIDTDWVFHPQIDWIIDPYKVMIFENLDQEIEQLNKEIGINIILNKSNISQKKHFNYTQSSIDFLKNYYAEDFKFYQQTMIGKGINYVI